MQVSRSSELKSSIKTILHSCCKNLKLYGGVLQNSTGDFERGGMVGSKKQLFEFPKV